ncbi:hypothetical protein HYH03_006188 [Edaphochlamys debaryana]|uniref:Uncharacterized protein n=1 Tax=Edaphochlamys debaryana TaxID=47281 RepID=A0A835Y447_9CHLO|nr:hypothetical protein HYH03_006188 [Edaphochlamys debaryana]|eukprot:KAG2495588.1 hypothetical protein HYH03_006188 [Edaphochlamys debaryana]
MWQLDYGDYEMSYIDSAGVVDRIRTWAATALRIAACEDKEWPAAGPPSLVLSGLVKAGKSFTLEHVVPAVVAEALRERGEGCPLADMVVLRLNANRMCRQYGAYVVLDGLLSELVYWARSEHVPMRRGSLEAVEHDLQKARANHELRASLGSSIQRFFEDLEVPVLVLLDEAHSLFLAIIDGQPDTGGRAYFRDSVMKDLLVSGPRTVLWCLTGSSMSHVWISLAEMPAYGTPPPILNASAVHLPVSYSAGHMRLAWEQLQERYARFGPLDPVMLELCPPSVPLLATMVSAWFDVGRPTGTHGTTSARHFLRHSLVDESFHEWMRSLGPLPAAQGAAVLALSSPGVGAWADTDLHPGLRRFLEPSCLDRKADGRVYLRDAYQRQVTRSQFNRDGTLRDRWSYVELGPTLDQLDAGWNLLRLGEAAEYLMGPGAGRRWDGEERPAWVREFEARLQALASDVGARLASEYGGGGGPEPGPRELWERQPWFQRVLPWSPGGSAREREAPHVGDEQAYVSDEQAYYVWDEQAYVWDEQAYVWDERANVWGEQAYVWDEQAHVWDEQAHVGDEQESDTHLAMLVLYLRLSRDELVRTRLYEQECYALSVDVAVIEALPRVLRLPLAAFNDQALVGALALLPPPPPPPRT